MKRQLWVDALAMAPRCCLATENDIWAALLFKVIDSPTALPIEALPLLGLILQAVWYQHWRCVLDDRSWCAQAAFAYFRQLLARYSPGTIIPPAASDPAS